MLTQFQSFVEQLMHRHGTLDELTQAELLTIAENLCALCETIDWDALQLPAANRGQEVLHELAVSSPAGPSAYLVSDGIGVTSPPHEHQTWAVIVGVRGKEMHTKYKVVPGDSREVDSRHFDQRWGRRSAYAGSFRYPFNESCWRPADLSRASLWSCVFIVAPFFFPSL